MGVPEGFGLCLPLHCCGFCSFYVVLWFVWHCLFLSYREISVIWEPTGCVCACFWTACLQLSKLRATLPDDPWNYLWQSDWELLLDFKLIVRMYVNSHMYTCFPNENLTVTDVSSQEIKVVAWLPKQRSMLNVKANSRTALLWWDDTDDSSKDFLDIIRWCFPKALGIWHSSHVAERSTGCRRVVYYMVLRCGFYVVWCNLLSMPLVFYFLWVQLVLHDYCDVSLCDYITTKNCNLIKYVCVRVCVCAVCLLSNYLCP